MPWPWSRKSDPKDYYKNYVADEVPTPLNLKLTEFISSFTPDSAFEFGCGTGKNLVLLKESIGDVSGIELSQKAVERCIAKGLDVVQGDEQTLLNMSKTVDIAFTCSVLDHIEEVDDIITKLKSMARKAVVLCETDDIVAKFYYAHDYESYGLAIACDGYTYHSKAEQGGDGATYRIYAWIPPIT
ncbi:MAG TPA: methionine biosynthesis protein MetW [Nitrososphaera sp.]|nr:methionine biosynthesis protein MetW [Nitrososphaera sp.]